jgi:LacI family transcriptional regulator
VAQSLPQEETIAVSLKSGAVPTIVEVAQQAGVSIKTVSRVLNHEANVRAQTREAVLRAVAALNYRPSLSARSLAGARSFLFGLLYYDPSAAFVAGLQRGATKRCRESGYHLVVESFGSDASDIAQQLDHMLAALRPDGVILTPPLCDNAEVLASLAAAGTPCVLLSPGARGKHLPQVRMDEVRAAEQLTERLIALGHRRIGFVKGQPAQVASSWRFKGFAKAMRAHGLPLDESLVCEGDFMFDSGVAAGERLLARRAAPTAIFASNDDMALGVLAAARHRGLQVPEQLSIVGFDDAPAASLVWPPLTTVRQPVFEMAVAAVEMLLERTGRRATAPAGEPALQRVLPHELMLRGSTAPPPRTLKR